MKTGVRINRCLFLWNPILFLLLFCVCSVCSKGENKNIECHITSFYFFGGGGASGDGLITCSSCPLLSFSFLQVKAQDVASQVWCATVAEISILGSKQLLKNLAIYPSWACVFFLYPVVIFYISCFLGLASQFKSCFILPWVFRVMPSEAQIHICFLRIKDDLWTGSNIEPQ